MFDELNIKIRATTRQFRKSINEGIYATVKLQRALSFFPEMQKERKRRRYMKRHGLWSKPTKAIRKAENE